MLETARERKKNRRMKRLAYAFELKDEDNKNTND